MNPLCWINKSLYGNVVFNLNPSDPIFIASTSNSMAGLEQDIVIDEFSRVPFFKLGNTDKWYIYIGDCVSVPIASYQGVSRDT